MKKFLATLGLMLGLIAATPKAAKAQAAPYNDIAVRNDTYGLLHPIPNATITVCSAVGTGIPCSPTVTIYGSADESVPLSDPFTADSNGNYTFYAPPGFYVVTITATGVTGHSYFVAVSCVPSTSGTCVAGASGSGTTINNATITNSTIQTSGLFTNDYFKNIPSDTYSYTLAVTQATGNYTYTLPNIGGNGTFAIIAATCTTVGALFDLDSNGALNCSTLQDNGTEATLTTEGFSLALQPQTVSYTNDSTGTTANKLVKYVQASNTVETTATTDTNGAIGVVYSGAGTSGTVQIAQSGTVDCVFDNATTAGDYVNISSTTAGDCHDAGSSLPSSGEVLGHVNSTNAAAGTYAINIFSPDVGGTSTVCKGKTNCGSGGSGTGSVTSINIVGNGVTSKTAVSGCPITSSGTCTLQVADASAGYVVAGPIPAPGTNVAVRQWTPCNSPQTNLSGEATFTCTLNNVVAGDQEVLWTYSEGGQWSPFSMSITDSLGSAWTPGASPPYYNYYETATVAASGNQTLTDVVSGNTLGYKYTGVLYLIEITGVASLDAAGVSPGSPSNPATATVTTTAANDGILVLSADTNGGTTYPTMSPVTAWFNQSAWSFNSVPSADQEGVYGAGAAGSYSFTGTLPGGSGAQNSVIAIAYKESASASSAPLVLRKLTEADLPPSAVSAIQAVYSKNLAANVSLTAATLTTLDSDAITMPTQGGPFRALVCYTYFISPGSGTYGESEVSDGTKTFDFDGHEVVGALDGSPYHACEISPESYANGATITFTVSAQNAGSQTVQTTSGTLSLPSNLQVTIFQSIN